MNEPLPCPFCGSKVVHRTVISKTFDLGPRKFNEWLHDTDDLNCPVRRHGRIIASGIDGGSMVEYQLERWNTRQGIIKDFDK